MSSNNWVVHGDHTETGMPLFAGDPHLGNTLPSSWMLYHLKWTNSDKILSGVQLPGMPMVGIGRSKDIVWSFTTSRIDTADLWQETLDETESNYLVDGQWLKLDTRTEVIKVKGQPDRVIQIKLTHRGPIIPHSILKKNSGLLFGGEAPSLKRPGKYSFAWQG